MADGGQIVFRGAILHVGLMINGFTNAFSSNLKMNINPEIFGNHEGMYT